MVNIALVDVVKCESLSYLSVDHPVSNIAPHLDYLWFLLKYQKKKEKGDKKNSKIKGILNENLRTRFDDTLATRADSSLPSSSTKM